MIDELPKSRVFLRQIWHETELKMQSEQKKRWLWGAQAVADVFCDGDRRKAYYLMQTGRIPAKKCGGDWVAEQGAIEAALSAEPAE